MTIRVSPQPQLTSTSTGRGFHVRARRRADPGPQASSGSDGLARARRFWERFRRPGPIPSQARGQVCLGPTNGLLNVLPAGGRVIGGFPFSLFLILQGAQIHGSSRFGLLYGLPEHLYSALLSFFDRQSFLAGQHVLIRKPGKRDARSRLGTNAPAFTVQIAGFQAAHVTEYIQRSLRRGQTKNLLGPKPSLSAATGLHSASVRPHSRAQKYTKRG